MKSLQMTQKTAAVSKQGILSVINSNCLSNCSHFKRTKRKLSYPNARNFWFFFFANCKTFFFCLFKWESAKNILTFHFSSGLNGKLFGDIKARNVIDMKTNGVPYFVANTLQQNYRTQTALATSCSATFWHL